jgi:hypothetical protein
MQLWQMDIVNELLADGREYKLVPVTRRCWASCLNRRTAPGTADLSRTARIFGPVDRLTQPA